MITSLVSVQKCLCSRNVFISAVVFLYLNVPYLLVLVAYSQEFPLSSFRPLLAGYVGTPPNVTLLPFNNTGVSYIITNYTCSLQSDCSVVTRAGSVCTGGYLTVTCLRC